MVKHTTNGAQGVESRVLPQYNADLLGAPFKVTLINSVREEFSVETGEKSATVIPDLPGVIRAAAAYRAAMPRRLRGAEIRFLRNAIAYQAKQMAEKLGMSPEHYSRVENDTKVLSSQSEKVLRVLIITKLQRDNDLASKVLARIAEVVDLPLEGAWSIDEELEVVLTYVRKERDQDNTPDGADDCANDNGDWYESPSLRRYGS